MRVERRTTIESSIAEVADWHRRPNAFFRLTPPWEPVRLTRPHPGLVNGSEIDLEVPVGPFSYRWTLRHENVHQYGFDDVQVKGPFQRWHHEHRFRPAANDTTELVDIVESKPPFGPLGKLAEPLIRKRVDRMLAYRHATLRADLNQIKTWGTMPPLTVAITGASGLIGQALSAMLTTAGHRIRPISRRPGPDVTVWDPDRGILDPKELEDVDAVVHLASESIDSRWTPAKKKRIMESRTKGTATVVNAMIAAGRPKTLVSASGINFYGYQAVAPVDETAGRGTGFLADVVEAWEAAAEPAQAAGIRVALARAGPVLSPAGGILTRFLLPFKLGVGGRLGDGSQWLSWISIDDCAAAYTYLLQSDLSGPVNLTAPHPVTNLEFTKILGRVLHRPTFMRVPRFALEAVLGQMAEETALASTWVLPKRLAERGFPFRHPTVDVALAHLLGREGSR